MTWENAYAYAGSLDAIDVLVDLVGRQPEPVEAALDVLRGLTGKLGVEVLVVPRSDAAITVAQIEAVAELLLDLCGRGLQNDDIAEEVQTVCMIARDNLDDLNYAHEEWPRPGR